MDGLLIVENYCCWVIWGFMAEKDGIGLIWGYLPHFLRNQHIWHRQKASHVQLGLVGASRLDAVSGCASLWSGSSLPSESFSLVGDDHPRLDVGVRNSNILSASLLPSLILRSWMWPTSYIMPSPSFRRQPGTMPQL